MWRAIALVALGAALATGAFLLIDPGGDDKAAPEVVTVRAEPPKLQRVSSAVSTTQGIGEQDQAFVREVTIEGSTLQWNGEVRNYEPTESFRRPAVVVVDPDGEFGIFAGGIADASAGRLWFATNSYVYRHVPAVGIQVWASRIPAAAVSRLNGGTTLLAVVGPGAHSVQLNSFQLSSQLSSPRQILEGRVELNFSQTGISGAVELYGGGYIEPGNSFPVDLYRATFAG